MEFFGIFLIFTLLPLSIFGKFSLRYVRNLVSIPKHFRRNKVGKLPLFRITYWTNSQVRRTTVMYQITTLHSTYLLWWYCCYHFLQYRYLCLTSTDSYTNIVPIPVPDPLSYTYRSCRWSHSRTRISTDTLLTRTRICTCMLNGILPTSTNYIKPHCLISKQLWKYPHHFLM